MNIVIDVNPLMTLYPELDDYYKTFIAGSELVAVLPALPKEDPNSQSYYASGHVSAVHMYINDDRYDPLSETDYTIKRFYMFDGEYHSLYGHRTVGDVHITFKKPQYDEILMTIESKPVVLYFMGCDDGSVGLRFASRHAAMDYLCSLTVFEDVFKNENLLYSN